MISDPTNHMKLCRTCSQCSPIGNFRLRNKHGTKRVNECRDCHNLAERVRRNMKRTAGKTKTMEKLLSRINDKRNKNRIGLIVGVLVTEFGGIEGFVDAWLDHYSQAKAKGGFGVLRCLESVLRMMEYSDQLARTSESLSEADLEANINESVTSLIQSCPELAVAAVRTLGWTLIPTKSA